jgi:hypothetical protein
MFSDDRNYCLPATGIFLPAYCPAKQPGYFTGMYFSFQDSGAGPEKFASRMERFDPLEYQVNC